MAVFLPSPPPFTGGREGEEVRRGRKEKGGGRATKTDRVDTSPSLPLHDAVALIVSWAFYFPPPLLSPSAREDAINNRGRLQKRSREKEIEI